MKYTQNSLNILTLKSFSGIGDAWVAKNFKPQMSIEEIVNLINTKTKNNNINKQEFLSKKESILKKLEEIMDNYDGITSLGDSDFPKIRSTIKDSDKPNVLFYKGDLKLLNPNNYNVTVIGLTNPTSEIEYNERKIVDLLAKKNATIVSGLALGCDRIAHHQALKSKTTTIAILPSPIHSIIPKACVPLGEYIGNNGSLLLSEYYEPARHPKELSTRYIRRDRLQALFSDLVLLIASYTPESEDKTSSKIDSGARHAMSKAKEYGIKRAVMYPESAIEDRKYDLNVKIKKEDNQVLIIDPNNSNAEILKLVDERKIKSYKKSTYQIIMTFDNV